MSPTCGRDESAEEVERTGICRLKDLRMPLHPDQEMIGGAFDRLDQAIGGGRGLECSPLADGLETLVVHAVHLHPRALQCGVEPGPARQRDLVGEEIAVRSPGSGSSRA